MNELLFEPLTTPEQWCEIQPCFEIGGVTFTQPLGSILVYLLALLWIAGGVYFWRIREGQRSREWMALALVLGGIGAGLAGTSYQFLGYELKCAGRDLCLWTHWFEVGYMMLQAASASAMLIAVATACTTGALRLGLVIYAVANTVAYIALATYGALTAAKALISFELLMLFAAPGLLLILVIAAVRWLRDRDSMDLALIGAGVWLIFTIAAYSAYLAAGFTLSLWKGGDGFYLSENDVLHIGMILFIAYLVAVVAHRLRDNAPSGGDVVERSTFRARRKVERSTTSPFTSTNRGIQCISFAGSASRWPCSSSAS